MNLIDFHVTEILGIESIEYKGQEFYVVHYRGWDDGGAIKGSIIRNTLEEAEAIKVGYVGQH